MTYEAEEGGNYKSPSDVKFILTTIAVGLVILVTTILVGM